jgi:hypothetical protein|tara:strand:- start:6010 stop:6273 length:264 start_codon:yes stop_codon:yes gene_type:complete
MKANARKAFEALKKIGAPVSENDWGYNEYFIISGEDNYPEIWADYYREFGGPGLDDFGVSLKINKILDKFGLFGEWINAGVLGVYDA